MSDDTVISAEGLGKRYLIAHQQSSEEYVALRDVLVAGARGLASRLLGTAKSSPKATSEAFWALKDVNFDIKRGEVVGIIGRNGAGKSTLLKVLSRITEPTEGRVTIRGRVASLLEVGTGFHPELTGRENIYLNGAILGMTRAEIRRKFDEIVAFAEVEKFLDTPVKRYSSGMYVRLAFAVAAHLEPEILVVDEVLAVGDAEFQKKCLGKMQDVSKGGRTVLFVSHNMAAVQSLTERCIVLDRGRLSFLGSTEQSVDRYLQLTSGKTSSQATRIFAGRGEHTRVISAALVDAQGRATSKYKAGDVMLLAIEFETDGTKGLSLEVLLADLLQQKIGLASVHQFEGVALPSAAGRYRTTLALAALHLAAGEYSIDVTTSIVNHNWDHYVADAARFEVPFSNPSGGTWNFQQSYGYGSVALPLCRPVEFVSAEGNVGDVEVADVEAEARGLVKAAE